MLQPLEDLLFSILFLCCVLRDGLLRLLSVVSFVSWLCFDFDFEIRGERSNDPHWYHGFWNDSWKLG